MVFKRGAVAGLFLVAGMALADAAPNIPPSEMPGRERERFNPSPIDRFTDPLAQPRNVEPLWQWCDEPKTKRTKQKQSERRKGC